MTETFLNGQPVNTGYGGEQDSKTRANYAKKMFKDLDESKFTSAGSFSQAGETTMYAAYDAIKNDKSLPTVIFHVDDVTSEKTDLGFSPINIDKKTLSSNLPGADFNKTSALQYVNGVESMQKDQILFVSTKPLDKSQPNNPKSYSSPTLAGSYINPIYEVLTNTKENDYGKYGFQTKEGVEIEKIYEDSSRSTVPKVYNPDMFISDKTYVTQYSDGTEYTFEVLELAEDHNSIKNKNSGGPKVEDMLTSWLQEEGIKFKER